MKAATIKHTSCEKDFVLKSIKSGIRLDGRQAFDYRNISIQFGIDYGCCEVQLGETRVLAQTSCELVKPIGTRPTEGQLHLNVDLSPMASPSFETGRMTSQGLEINRLIERCIKESRCIDVESLCLIAGEKVWSIRVDIVVLNDCGNILDCSCIAGIASLAHFKHHDVTVTGTEVIIHNFKEKDPIPLNVHHMPISTTFGFIDDGEQMIIDPEEKEESILSGKLIMAFNIYGEVCCAQMSGGVSFDYEQILQCAKISSVKSSEITNIIKTALDEDRTSRAPVPLKKRPALKDPPNLITRTVAEPTPVDTICLKDVEPIVVEHFTEKAERLGYGTASIGSGGESLWVISDGSDNEDSVNQIAANNEINLINHKEDIVDSEEEEVAILDAAQLEGHSKKSGTEILNTTDLTTDILNTNSIINKTNRSINKKKKKKKKVVL
ncbi:exosome complex component RRP45 isoform X1 [Hydra vulgaris]|uniref:Exosome complex component RRP45 n=1 Tax=Hydra vulgaris TaxID=6087 RepID=T2ME23_HYDVU